MPHSSRPETVYSVDPFFETSPNLLCIAGFDGYFKRINSAVSRTLGYSEAELLARPIRDFIHPDDHARTSKQRELILEGKPLLDFENRYVCKDGKVVWLSWHSVPVEDRELVYAIAKDISDIKAREAHRNQQLSELAALNQRLKRQNEATAHDLRSPAAALHSLVRLIETSTISDVETLEIIEVLKCSSADLVTLLDRYVDNLDTDVNGLALELLHLEEVFRQVVRSIHFIIERSCANFHLDFKDCPELIFHRSYLEGIYLNLITNSIKYAHPERCPEITICSRKVEGGAELSFADNGIGFDAERHKNRIFGLHQSFHQRDDSKGVGLYLIHHYMTSVGGRISVQSQVGEGTTFTLYFPDR